MCVTQYCVTSVGCSGDRDPPAGTTARNARAGLPAAPQHAGVGIRAARRTEFSRLRDRRQHAVSAATTVGEAGASSHRAQHRRESAAQVLPHYRERDPTRGHAHRRLPRDRRRNHRTAPTGNTSQTTAEGLIKGHHRSPTDHIDAALRTVPERQGAGLGADLRSLRAHRPAAATGRRQCPAMKAATGFVILLVTPWA